MSWSPHRPGARFVWTVVPRLFVLAVISGVIAAPPRVHAQSDTQPPTVVSQSPSPSASGVSTQIVVQAIFNEPIQPASLTFVLRNASGTIVPSVSSYDDATRTASLDPSSDLTGATQFTATVTGVRDLAGNLIAAPVTWSFTTGNPAFQDSVVFSGLTEPTAMEFASDGRIFVAEKSGLIKVFASLTATTPTIFADLRTNVYNFIDRGLLGLALHPQFPTVPYVYVLYSHDAPIGGTAPRFGSPGATSDPCPTPPGPTTDGCVISARLSRLEATGNVRVGPEVVLVEDWFQQFPSHSIGTLMFGPDGALYASAGDGASYSFVDYGQTGIPKNPGGDPPVPVGGTQTPPTAEGGALRSQDLRTLSDPVTLDGTVIRIDPETAAALPDNPLFSNPDANARRIIAHGLRNPFRFTFRPGTREIWVGDVGWNNWEEIDRIIDATDSVVDNFGWPCYEGPQSQEGYDSANLNLCNQLYSEGGGSIVQPFYTYEHAAKVSTEACTTGSSSISGVAFYEGTGNYPSNYPGALFFADYSRNCLWVMLPDAGGVPDPATRKPLLPSAAGPVQLKIGPGGDLFYVSLDGAIRRIRYFPGNQPPVASAQATPSAGSAPLSVSLSAAGSTDPENAPLSYSWDLDGDGQFDDALVAQTNWTYGAGAHVARVRVVDNQGLSDVGSVTVLVNESYPTATITTPNGNLTWKVGDPITFSGSATDSEDGQLPATSLDWSVIIHHCPVTCHTHLMQSFENVAGGSFNAPDHEYPSHLELKLTATDSAGLQDTKSVILLPQTVPLTFASNPTGRQLVLNSTGGAAPFTRTVIVGSNNSISAPSPQGNLQFSAWSDGGAQTHNVIAGAAPTNYTATFVTPPASASLVLGLSLDEGTGTVVGDASGNANAGTISGATWTTPGRYGSALSFDGVDDIVSVPDGASLDRGQTGTIAAWVKLSAVNRWNAVMAKGGVATDDQHNYAIDIGPDNRPNCIVGNGASFNMVAATTVLSPLQWYHLACTWDGTQLRFYINGTLNASAAQTITPFGNAAPLFVGQYGGGGDRLAGVIDEVRVYSQALTGPDLLSAMNTALADSSAPVRSNGQPSGTLPAGTTQTTLSLTTNETATCRYATTAGVMYASMSNTFNTTGGTSHSTTLTGLLNGTNYTRYVRCVDGAGNANPDDFAISFAVGSPGSDTTPPLRSNGQPTGTLAAGTTQTTLSLTTNENATCRYATTAGVTYSAMSNTFATTGGTAHSTTLTGLTNGTSYTRYVRCVDSATNANPDDFTVSFAIATTAPAPTLMLGLALDEGAGTSVADASGNGNTGSVSGATWTTPGKSGSALSFDGVNDLVSVPDSASLDRGQSGTVAAWVKLGTLNRWNAVLAKASTALDAQRNYAIEIGSDNRANCVIGNGTGFDMVVSTTPLVLQQWYHLACTWDGAQLRFYVDGNLNASATQTVTPGANAAPLFVGQYGGNTDWFTGVIDDVRIYSAALTGPQLQTVMTTPLADGAPPVRSNGQPTGMLPMGTTQTTLSLTTNEAATCRYATTAGVAYASMANTFSTTGGTSHSTTLTGLTNGTNYTRYVRCVDGAGNANPNDFPITFAVASAGDVTPPLRSNGQPTGTLPAGTTQTALSLTTNENATCRYATTAGVAYSAMPNTFATTGATSHSTTLTGLADGTSYARYVRCVDSATNANTDDLIISFAVASTAPAPTLAFGLALDEGAGTLVADASGNGNTGSISGATWTTPGKSGSALSFDGVNDLVSVPDSASLDRGQSGTVAAWVKLGALNRWNAVLAKASTALDAQRNYAIEIGSDNRANCVIGNGTGFNMVGSTTPLVLQQWYHLACTWDGAQLRFYVDGSLNASATQSVTPVGNAAPLFVGQYGGNTDWFAGVIDDVRIYSAALTGPQLQTVMTTPLADGAPPVRSNGQPTGTLPIGTTQTTLSLTTNEAATCRYATTPGVAYASMTNMFSTTGGTSHSTTLTGLTNGTSYTRYVRCVDGAGNANPDDLPIAFNVADGSQSSLSISDVSVTEGNSGTKNVTFTVTLSAASVQTATVAYATANGSALAVSDYVAKTGTLTFTPGVVSRTFTVAIVGDRTQESTETFVVNLSNAMNAAISDSQAICTVLDND